jgi:hypothetical protein
MTIGKVRHCVAGEDLLSLATSYPDGKWDQLIVAIYTTPNIPSDAYIRWWYHDRPPVADTRC